MKVLINIVAFKIAWLSSVLGAANGLPLLGPAVAFLVVAIHMRGASAPSREFSLIVLTCIIGASWDSVMVSAGWLSYASGTFLTGVAPYWIFAMWIAFATTLNLAFRWLQSRLLMAALLGAISGPASYFAGAKIGAVVFNDANVALIALAGAWAVLLPGLLVLAKRLDGVNRKLSSVRSSGEYGYLADV